MTDELTGGLAEQSWELRQRMDELVRLNVSEDDALAMITDHDPERFGVPTFEDGRIVRIDEKPSQPASSYAVIGIYMYDNTVFDFIKTLKPSARGELEITDVNNYYIDKGAITHDILDGWWTDAGTFESLQYAGNMVAKTGANRV